MLITVQIMDPGQVLVVLDVPRVFARVGWDGDIEPG